MMDSNSKMYINWPNVEESIDYLKFKMEISYWIPDIIVGIANGGVVPATLLSKKFKIPVRTVIVQLRDGDIQERNSDIEQYIKDGKRVLLVDDINDTGSTLQHIKNNWDIDDSCWGNNLRTAVIHERIGSKFETDFQSDIIKTNEWVVYPWE